MRKRLNDWGVRGLATLAWLCAAGAVSAAAPAAGEPPGGETNSPPSAVTALVGDTAAAPPCEVRLGQAVLMALTNNRALSVQRLTPAIQRTFEQQERALFDPVVAGELTSARDHTATNGLAGDTTQTVGGTMGVSDFLPTGTRLAASLTTERERRGGSQLEYATKAELAATQALLRGRPLAANLVSLRQAGLDTTICEHELRGFAEALVADVESTYWECVLARRRVEILEQSLSLAERQLREIGQRIKVGALPETEEAAARAEVALRREALINARSGLATSRLGLLRRIAPDALRGPRADLRLMTEPAVPALELGTLESHVAIALRRRPDLSQARLKIQRGDLELVRTRNGLLPRMDLFIRLGKTGYAASFGKSLSEIGEGAFDVAAGIAFETPIRNRQARALHERALFTREQEAQSLRNLEDLVRVDVESAYIEVERTREQIAATATTLRFQEETLRAETTKLNVGRSTAMLVAQAQRDLVLSQVAEVEAVVRHLEAWVGLLHLEGSLLDWRGITVSGGNPADLTPEGAPAPPTAPQPSAAGRRRPEA